MDPLNKLASWRRSGQVTPAPAWSAVLLPHGCRFLLPQKKEIGRPTPLADARRDLAPGTACRPNSDRAWGIAVRVSSGDSSHRRTARFLLSDLRSRFASCDNDRGCVGFPIEKLPPVARDVAPSTSDGPARNRSRRPNLVDHRLSFCCSVEFGRLPRLPRSAIGCHTVCP